MITRCRVLTNGKHLLTNQPSMSLATNWRAQMKQLFLGKPKNFKMHMFIKMDKYIYNLKKLKYMQLNILVKEVIILSKHTKKDTY